ncbi:hypothetical protein Syun_023393 [Stephania yunnanensis]|uniref:Uncharacterized protein n=1 Tax=Stephania yunnanensis TaxID=152371 RepID=A0AAP0I283_9MAGN
MSFNVAAQASLKLTIANYPAWLLQFTTLLTGYDLFGFIDGARTCLEETINTNGVTNVNPAYHLWRRQDQFILSAFIGALSPSMITFIATATTSFEAWTILNSMFGNPTRGRTLEQFRLLITLNR